MGVKRYELSEAQWRRIAPLLPGKATDPGRTGADNRLFVLLGYHPWFLMTGMPTHFRDRSGRDLAIESHVHLFADHAAAALAVGWRLMELKEALIDDAWIAAKPKWAVHRDRPISFGWVWRKAA